MVLRFLYMTLLTLGPFNLVAQGPANIGWGIKGGINVSGAQTDNTLILKNDVKPGWQLGVFSKSVSAGWGYLAEAQVNTFGSVQQFGDERQKNTLGYLTLPMAWQYVTANHWSFMLGGYASFRLWAKRQSSKPGVGDFEADIKDNIAFIDYGVWAGIGFQYQRILFDFRYLQGIADINTNTQLNARVRNAGGQFSVGYFF